MGIFLIGEEVEFNPEARVISGSNSVVKLHSSSVYCFELLISQQGCVVEHEAFYDFAWRRFGMEVSSNALYQSISMLRKSLAACGIKGDIILTTPRRGFTLSKNITITFGYIKEIESKENEEVTKKVVADIFTEYNDDLKGCNKIDAELNPSKKNFKRSVFDLFFCKRYAFMVFAFNILLALGVCFFCFPVGNLIYNKSGGFDKCIIYSDGHLNYGDVAGYALLKKLNCEKRKHIYISSSPVGNRISVVQCARELSYLLSSNCVSYYYVEER